MENIGLIVAFAALSITMVGVLISCMFWMRGEANSLRAEAKEDRKDLLNMVNAIREHIFAIQLEIRDFHVRLCAIEERNKK